MIRCCRDCKDRCVGCHGTCERYLREKQVHDKVCETIHADKELKIAIGDIIQHGKKAKKKRK